MFDESQIRMYAYRVVDTVNVVLQPDHLKVNRIFLVGSYAQGKPTEWSDVDFLVELIPYKGRHYPTWKQVTEVHRRLGTARVHVIYGTQLAQESLLQKKGDAFKYREIQLAKESIC